MFTFSEEVDALVTAGLLTEHQATAFVLREIEAVPREQAAESMDISASGLDDARAKAVRKVEDARATVEAVENIRYQLPDDE